MEYKIRNNALNPRGMAGKLILPGQTVSFTEEELAPYEGSAVITQALAKGKLEFIRPDREPTPVVIEPVQVPRPDMDKPGEAEGKGIRVENKAAVAAFLQGDLPKPEPENAPAPVDLSQIANIEPGNGPAQS